ncbi:MAG: extracellular solute-binding protein [Provencibacterium sp.]|nr:extracellular solute-binding protein [Provencibacterium sp.]
MKKTRMPAVLLAAALLFSACQSGGPSASSNAAPSSSAPASSAPASSSAAESSSQPDESGAPTLEGEHELTVEIFERGVAGQLPADKSFHTDWIRENFAKEHPNIKLNYMPVPRAQELEKLNILMASKEAPDICVLYNTETLYSYVDQGGVAELGEAIEKYGPNLQAYLGDSMEYGIFNGKQYALSAKRVNQAKHGSYIRKDWLDKLGLSVPANMEEFHEALLAFKEKDPGGLGSETIPFAMNADFSESTWPISPILDSFTEEMSDEDFYCLPRYMWPGVKEGVRFVNQLFNEGLINVDFPLDNDKAVYKELIAQGKVGAFINNTAFPLGNGTDAAITNLQKNVPGAELIPMDPFINEARGGKTWKQVYDPTGIYIFVPSFSKSVDAAVVYLDWITRSDNLFFLHNGVEGEHYEMKDGIPVPLVVPDDNPRKMSPATIDVTLTTNGQDLGDPELNRKLFSLSYTDPAQQALYEQEYVLSTKDGYLLPRFDRPIQSQLKYNSVLKNFETEILVKSVTAPADQFDATFDGLIQEYLTLGAQEVIDEKRVAYQEMKG